MTRNATQEKEATPEQADDIKEQVPYVCEGFIKTVGVKGGKVTFTLEPAAPYLFEKKEADGKVKKLLLFVDDPQKPDSAKIVGDKDKDGTWFSAPSKKCDLSAMLIAKANRLKVMVASELKNDTTDEQGYTDKDKSSQYKAPIVLCELKVL